MILNASACVVESLNLQVCGVQFVTSLSSATN